MRYSILGFNQEKVMQTQLDMTDLMLLNYILTACGSPVMKHMLTKDGKPLVWINHKKLSEDLPILRLSEGSLRNRIAKLKQDGYLYSETVAGESKRGTKTYYGLTELTMSLIYDMEITTMSSKNDMNERPRHSKMTSNNVLDLDNKLENNTISKDIVSETEPKEKKPNLYQKCLALIEEFTEDDELRSLLDTYLKMRLAMKDKPIYGVNQWKGLLNKLNVLGGDIKEIIQYSTERGYASFYAPQKYQQSTRPINKAVFGENDDNKSVKVTQEEIANGYFTGQTI